MAVPYERIQPGLLTPQSAAALQVGAGQAEQDRQAIAKWLDSMPMEFPAKLTAYDQATGRCSWTMQMYDEVGRRMDHHNGVTGTVEYMPAYPVGNGVMPPTDPDGSGSGSAFPIDVWMRLRIITATLGPVYEFDWQCACDFGYYPSGSGFVASGSGVG